VLIAFFRHNVGADYQSYIEIIENIDDHMDNNGIEYSFYYLVKIVKWFDLVNAQIYIISTYSIITGVGLYFVLKKLDYPINFIYFYIFFSPLYLQSFNLVRLFAAVPIIWYALISKYKFSKVAPLVFTAGLIHYSAFALFFLLPILNYRLRIRYKIIFSLACWGIFSKIELTGLYYSNYVRSGEQDYNLVLFSFLLLAWLWVERIDLPSSVFGVRNIAFLSFLFPLLAMALDAKSDTIFRFSYYFMFFIPLVLSLESNTMKINTLLSKIFCRYFLPLVFIVGLFFKGELNSVVPYQSFI